VIDRLTRLSGQRLALIDEMVLRRRAGGVPAALEVIGTGRGRAIMDSVETLIAELGRDQERLLVNARARSASG
jgi:CHASE3 domain sensor protein